MARSREALCLGIAEQGKLHALKGRHVEALRHYREALRLASSCAASELFFHHCAQCIMESLELSGSHEAVADYCVRAEDHFAAIETDDVLVRRQRGANFERLAVSRHQTGDAGEARELFAIAIEIAGKGALPLSEALLDWLRRGLTVSEPRLRSAQRQYRYFVVREDLVDPSIAVELPKGVGGLAA
jgi:tetratricopeptide (TPR) repeat protein